METTMQPLSRFVAKHGVTIRSEWADANPNMDSDQQMNHYKVTLRAKGRQLTTYFSMGLGLSGEPKVGNVLDCLASDSASIENARSFEDWAGDLGYDTDSRKAEKTFKACERQAAKLKQFLGEDAYNELLWNTERE
jgi:hypothetical protein